MQIVCNFISLHKQKLFTIITNFSSRHILGTCLTLFLSSTNLSNCISANCPNIVQPTPWYFGEGYSDSQEDVENKYILNYYHVFRKSVMVNNCASYIIIFFWNNSDDNKLKRGQKYVRFLRSLLWQASSKHTSPSLLEKVITIIMWRRQHQGRMRKVLAFSGRNAYAIYYLVKFSSLSPKCMWPGLQIKLKRSALVKSGVRAHMYFEGCLKCPL